MKNIILIITDTFRYDNLFDRAVHPVRTPNLDRFATERAVEMRNFWTGSFPTIPHRTDLTTGRMGFTRYGWQDLKLSGRNAFPAMLADHGYVSQLVCDCPHLFNTGFQHTFTAAYQHRGQESDIPLLHLNDEIRNVVPDEKTRSNPERTFRGSNLVSRHRWTNRYFTCEEEAFSYRTASTAVRWLEENYTAGPFFLWTDFFDPHEPWDPPEYLVRRYQEEYEGIPMLHPNYGRADAYTEAELVNLRAHYAAEAEMVDRAIGRILHKVDDLRLWDDTVVVVTSDHGCSIGERNRTGKLNLCPDDGRYWPIYPEVGHVPFLAAVPGTAGGTSRKAYAQPLDIAPTLAELAGVTLDAPDPVEGTSFARVLNGSTDSHRSTVLSACHADYANPLPERAITPFLVNEGWAYVPVGAEGGEELYNLVDDPLAEHDLVKENTDRLPHLRDAFRTNLEQYGNGGAAADFWLKGKR